MRILACAALIVLTSAADVYDFYTPVAWRYPASLGADAWFYDASGELSSRHVSIVNGKISGLSDGDFDSAEGKTAMSALEKALQSESEIEQLNVSINELINGGLYVDVAAPDGSFSSARIKYGGVRSNAADRPENPVGHVKTTKIEAGDGIRATVSGSGYRIEMDKGWPTTEALHAATKDGWVEVVERGLAVDDVSVETNMTTGAIQIKGFNEGGGGTDTLSDLLSNPPEIDSFSILARYSYGGTVALSYIPIGSGLNIADGVSVEQDEETGELVLAGFDSAEPLQIPFVGTDGVLSWMDQPNNVEYDPETEKLTITENYSGGGHQTEVLLPLADEASIESSDMSAFSLMGFDSAGTYQIPFVGTGGYLSWMDPPPTVEYESVSRELKITKRENGSEQTDTVNLPDILEIRGLSLTASDAGSGSSRIRADLRFTDASGTEHTVGGDVTIDKPLTAEQGVLTDGRSIDAQGYGPDVDGSPVALQIKGFREGSSCEAKSLANMVKEDENPDRANHMILTRFSRSGGAPELHYVDIGDMPHPDVGQVFEYGEGGKFRLKAGADGQVLMTSGGTVAWGNGSGIKAGDGISVSDGTVSLSTENAQDGNVITYSGGKPVWRDAPAGGGPGAVKVMGNEGSLSYVTGTNIVFESAEDSDVRVSVTDVNGVIHVKIGVYYK